MKAYLQRKRSVIYVKKKKKSFDIPELQNYCVWGMGFGLSNSKVGGVFLESWREKMKEKGERKGRGGERDTEKTE